MGSGYVLTIAVRPQRLSVDVFAANGRVEGATRAWELLDDGMMDGHVTPDQLLASVLTLVTTTLRRSGVSALAIEGIGISAPCASVTAWHRVTGEPVGVWRTPVSYEMWDARERVRFLVRCVRDRGVDPTHLRFGGMESWLLWNLTGGHDWSLDASHDLAPLCAGGADEAAAQEALAEFGIARSALPQVVREVGPFAHAGPIFLHGVGAPFVAICGVAPALLIGCGCDNGADAAIAYERDGFTASFVDAAEAGVSRSVARMGSRQRCLAMQRFFAPQLILDWLEGGFDLRDALSDIADALREGRPLVRAAVDAHGDHQERADVLGIARETTPAQLYAAAWRSLAFSVQGALHALGPQSGERGRLFADLSGYATPVLLSFQAAVSGRSVYAAGADPLPAGVALLTFVGTGLLPASELTERAGAWSVFERFEAPPADAAVAALQREWERLYGSP
jgi:glycerol kinase